MAAKEFTGDELASSGFIAFQGGVYDLADFAVGHPGGADLITEWTGKDGTDSLLDAHPGGKAFIKHTLGPKGFATALKGASPRSTLCDIHPRIFTPTAPLPHPRASPSPTRPFCRNIPVCEEEANTKGTKGQKGGHGSGSA
jgi:predicted heme/steroid binding protein